MKLYLYAVPGNWYATVAESAEKADEMVANLFRGDCAFTRVHEIPIDQPAIVALGSPDDFVMGATHG
jgi:hypothetical protein